MDDYICKQDAVDALKAQADTMRTWVERYAEQRRGILTAVNIVEDIEPADVVPVIHGTWERHMSFGICDQCGYEYNWTGTDAKNYCPNCGAKMDGGE